MQTLPEYAKLSQVVQKITPNSKLLRYWPLTGGISAAMTALETKRPDGQICKIIVRQYSKAGLNQALRTAEKEFRLLQMTHAMGLHTPKPFHLDQTGQIFPAPYLVIELIEGEMTFTPADMENHMRQLAAQLVQIHRIDSVNNDLSFLPESAFPCGETQRRRPAPIDLSLGEERIETLLASHRLTPQNTPALLHGDFWPGNTLWQDDQLAAVIDWEDAERGDPLIDLGKSRSEIVWIFGIDAMNSFTSTYQSAMQLDYTNLAYWDLCAALRFIRLANGNLAALAAYFEPYGRSDITEQTIRTNVRHFITQALAKLT